MSKTLMITGASKGIGKAIAELFAQQGWKIVNIARSACSTGDALNIHCDLTQTASIESALAALLATLRVPEQLCLIHNAAIFFNDSVKNPDLNQQQQLINLSLVAPAILNQLLIPYMASSSSIIYIGSTLSEKAVANAASYVACKHAMVGFMRATCQDLARDGIHTCCVCPGFTDTNMMKERCHTEADFASFLAFAKRQVGANRLVTPQEIAAVAYFSAQNPAINGAVLHANLGQLQQ